MWSSEEEKDSALLAELDSVVETEPTPPPKKIIKKIIKKFIRAHRTTTTTVATTKKAASSEFFTSVEVEQNDPVSDGEEFTKESRRSGMTTTPSARRDLPAKRRLAENRVDPMDNARDIDEETILSPFEDPEMTTPARPVAQSNKPKGSRPQPKIDFQVDEDLEEVISKLSVRRPDIRRSPVRNSVAEAQFAEKAQIPQSADKPLAVGELHFEKDGVKTHEPKNGEPIEMKAVDMQGDESPENKYGDERQKSPEERENALVPMDVVDEEENLSTSAPDSTTTSAPVTRSTTTVYDPANFYHTSRPKPAKKEKILRFCSKEAAIRDQANMVIACGLDEDIWTPRRCPDGADCFPSHDSLYRICCPVHHG